MRGDVSMSISTGTADTWNERTDEKGTSERIIRIGTPVYAIRMPGWCGRSGIVSFHPIPILQTRGIRKQARPIGSIRSRRKEDAV